MNFLKQGRVSASILNSGKALLTSWNGPVADPPNCLFFFSKPRYAPVLVYSGSRREARSGLLSRTLSKGIGLVIRNIEKEALQAIE